MFWTAVLMRFFRSGEHHGDSDVPSLRHPPHREDGGEFGKGFRKPPVRSPRLVPLVVACAGGTHTDCRTDFLLGPLLEGSFCLVVVWFHAVGTLDRGCFVVKDGISRT